MELEKINGKNCGIYIKLIIGKKENTSYFEAPQENIDYAGIEYIKGRYPIVTTKERDKAFKRLYKNLWIAVTDYQLELMQHCIGIGRSKKPYRNYFFTQEIDINWNELVRKELAIKGTNHPNNDEYVYFRLSQQGLEFILEKSVSYKIYNEL